MVADLRLLGLGYEGVGDELIWSFGSPPMGSYQLPVDTYYLSLTVLELFRWLQKRLGPSIRLSDPDMMTNTALEATVSSSGKKLCFMTLVAFCCSTKQ